ncbi:MAG: 3-phosphoglycerate dehydrogenase, partial [Atopobiaceae bacterium]|nr:3-phosphoglycerate dehydrogenase [Atopobiaceae bacterium]
MYKVNCINNIAKVGTDALGKNFVLTDDTSSADAIMVRSANLHEMEFSDNLLAIARAGAGVNNIPLDRCAEKGIVVFNTPGANANGVKELVIAGMLMAARDILGGIDWVERHYDDPNVGTLAEKAKNRYAGTELAGKTLGVIGLGAIGAMVANAGRSLGMHVLGYDPYLSVKYAWSLDRHVRHVNDLKEIWANADYITVHVPATNATRGLISREAIAAMKDDVVVLNYARDVLVDDRAMAEALQEGHVARYMTDFANANSTQ